MSWHGHDAMLGLPMISCIGRLLPSIQSIATLEALCALQAHISRAPDAGSGGCCQTRHTSFAQGSASSLAQKLIYNLSFIGCGDIARSPKSSIQDF